jgi:DNA-binding CsgD family transcriptional regulator
MSVGGSRRTLVAMSSGERARSAYFAAAVDGDLGVATPAGDGGVWAAVARAHVLLHGDGDLDAAHRLLVDAIDSGAAPDDGPEALTAAFDTLLTVCRFADREVLWLPYRVLAARYAGRVPTPTGPVGTVRAGWCLLDVDGVARQAAALRGLLEHGEAVGPAINAAVLLALDAFAGGRWDDTYRLAGQAQALCASHGYEALAMLAAAGPALVAACRGDEVACLDHTSAMIGWAAPRGARFVHRHAMHARVLAALGRGDAESAYHLIATVTPPGVVEPDGAGRLSVMDLVEAAVRTQRRDEAAAHVRAARRAGVADVSARSALLVAGAAASVEHGDQARALYEQALAAPQAQAWPFDVARVRLAYGEHLRRARAMLEARGQLTIALTTFRRLGADPWTARAESELRAAGHRVHRAPGIASTVLSHQERTVARLAAKGATNRQIGQQLGLSPRTVGSHLTRVFQKMRVTSRAALGEALRAASQD